LHFISFQGKESLVKKRIFVVDDEPHVTHLLKSRLETLGYYHVEESKDPPCAVAAACRFSPDLILLDVMMPEMDGSELMAIIAGSPLLRNIPVIFLAALVTKAEGCDGSFVSGHRTYLPKPIDLESLVSCIERRLSEKRSVDKRSAHRGCHGCGRRCGDLW
jgi:CheY-like chemotaxis protein